MSYKEYILDNKRNKEYLQLQYVHRVRAQYTRISPLTPPCATAGLETQDIHDTSKRLGTSIPQVDDIVLIFDPNQDIQNTFHLLINNINDVSLDL
uniref:Uncharacterized protein n=1 Tax=Heterorhabditis bacteriophora TaxID=37862 RepID=A0A1I7WFF4_HETBA